MPLPEFLQPERDLNDLYTKELHTSFELNKQLTEAVLRNRHLNIKIGNLEKELELAEKAFIRIRDETVNEDEAHNIALTALTNIKFESNSSEEIFCPSPELKQQRIAVPSETNQVVKRGRPPGSKNRPKV